MAEMLFPQRQRCKKCGKGLGADGAAVFLGLYDTARCAGVAEPVKDPSKAPRECVTQRDGKWQWKRRFRSENEIPDKLKQDPSTSWYWCGSCSHLHIGHTRMGEAESFRGLRDRVAVADWLVKLRGNAKHADVAKAAQARGASKKVLAIRIKEWEDPKFDNPSMETLFAILPLYQAGLGGSMKSGRR